MAGLTSLLQTAKDALSAQSYGLTVTGQNISNVNSEGYVRREAILQSRPLGSYGTVEVAGLRRAADQFTERRLYEVTGLSSAAAEHHFHLVGVEQVFAEGDGAGVGSSLDAVFGALSDLSVNPSDTTARSQVLERVRQFAERVAETGDRLAEIRAELLQKADAATQDVNDKAGAIAQLNRQIQMIEARGEDAADLKDQRAQLLLGLSEQVNVHTFTNGSGELVIQAAGTTLVEGGEAQSMSIGLDPGGDMQLFVQRGSGPPTEITSFLSGGALEGIKRARDVDVAQVATDLDQFAFDVATALNAQHAAGFGLDGVGGRNLLVVSATPAGAARSLELDPAMAGQPDRVAAAGAASALPGDADNLLALSDLANQTLATGGTRTFSEAYSDLVGDVGSRTGVAQNDALMRDAMTAQVYALQQSESGVSLDEEMVSLTRYQRAYEAAARVLTTVDQLLQELMSAVR